jgi:hypothetical protein
MNYEKKRIYIVVKTYPTASKEYAELVCTAGVLEDGTWIRLYPIPFRKLDDEQKFRKFTWIEAEVIRNTSDFRPETYRPNIESIALVQRPKTVDWDERKRIIFKNKQVFTNLEMLIKEAKSDAKTSLAVFKPTKIHSLVVEEDEREWDDKILKSLHLKSMQLNVFQTPEETEIEFKTVQKVPYKFSYSFEDDAGIKSTLMITDWEIGMLFFNCLKRTKGNEKVAIEKVREKYFDEFLTKDIYFFLGTTKQFHNVGPNPFIIIGVFCPPIPSEFQQLSLFDMMEE